MIVISPDLEVRVKEFRDTLEKEIGGWSVPKTDEDMVRALLEESIDRWMEGIGWWPDHLQKRGKQHE